MKKLFLEINMEKMPVMSMKPNSTFSDFLPKGAMRVLAISTSSPLLVAAMAITKPPRKRMMVGSAKQCGRYAHRASQRLG